MVVGAVTLILGGNFSSQIACACGCWLRIQLGSGGRQNPDSSIIVEREGVMEEEMGTVAEVVVNLSMALEGLEGQMVEMV